MNRILVVEDDRNAQMLIRHLLEENGYAIFEADDGRAAYDLAQQVQPDLVITDVFMPVIFTSS